MRVRFDSNRVELVLPNPWRWPMRLVALGFVGWVVVLLVGAESGFGLRGPSSWATWAIAALGLYALGYLRKDHKRRHGRLHADRDGLEFDAEPLAPKRKILAVHLVTGRRFKLQVTRLGHIAPVELRLESLKDGRTILQALELEMSQGTAQYELPVTKAIRYTPLPILVGVIAVVFAVFITPAALAVAAVSAAIFFALVRTRRLVAVGSDGVLIRYGFWRRFVELRQILRVDHIERTTIGATTYNGVDLVLQTEERVLLLAPSDFMYDAQERAFPLDPFGHQLKERLGQLMQRLGSASEATKEAKLLRRQGRSAAEWFEELRSIGSGSSRGYRSAPVSPHALWQLFEDPAAEPSVRLGAAVALASSSAHRDAHRLGVTTATVLAPALRRALDRVRQA
ncbi:MAG: hypothetical protein JRI23_20170, partial [Deltaproteobacteria bacterium]|nr:hypothetical protein [Deltaproteobacteria bacterium]MBW2534192.1 hypothetical protein [Deltaproteobacteria bacterium]